MHPTGDQNNKRKREGPVKKERGGKISAMNAVS